MRLRTSYWVLLDAIRQIKHEMGDKHWLCEADAFFIGGKETMKESRHNGRAGKNGVYNPKHNDRSFDINNSNHIDDERVKHNIYWDCYQGYRSGEEFVENLLSFEDVEKKFYEENYGDFCREQNARNVANRHPERNRSTEDIRLSKKTCPEETIIQFGNISESIDYKLLVDITEEYYERLDSMYGSHYHIIDWALHVDEGTPHIHERHVFDCENKYGEIAPQQENALRAMEFELPDPGKKEGRHNNRKMTFDKDCRELLAQIAAEHGVYIDLTPSYGGRDYMEKQDYIIAKQKEEIVEITKEIDIKQKELDDVTMKISDVTELVKGVVDDVYEKAVEVTKTKAEEIVGNVIIDNITRMDENINASDKYNKGNKIFASSVLKQLKGMIQRSIGIIGDKIRDSLLDSPAREETKAVIEEKAEKSIKEHLVTLRQQVNRQESESKKIRHDIEYR